MPKVSMVRLAGLMLVACLASAPAAAQTPNASRAELVKELKEIPVYVVLEAHYPAVFRLAVETIEDGFAKGRSMRDMQTVIRDAYAELLKTQMPRAEGTYVLQSLRISRDQAEALAAAPADCMAILGFAPLNQMVQGVLPDELIKAEQDWAAEMLRQTAIRPVRRTIAPPSEKTVQLIALTAYDALSSDDARQRIARLGGKFQGVADPGDQRAICEFNIQFANAVLALPTQEAVDAFLGITASP